MRLAADADVPVILHTPPTIADDPAANSTANVYEANRESLQERVLEGEESLAATKLDIDCAREAGLPEDRVVVSHADETLTEYVLDSTDCHLSFTVGYPWLTGVTAADVATAIETYGPNRIMLNTDCAGTLKTDPFAIKRSIFELYHRGIDVETIKQVVYENPTDVFFE